jgi:hypothetical protein
MSDAPAPLLSLDAAEAADAARALVDRLGQAGRVALDPDRVEQDLARLVLALMELLRQVVELQAIRRMEAGRLTAEEEERVGLTLWRAKEKLHALAAQFGLSEADLSLRLNGLGRIV